MKLINKILFSSIILMFFGAFELFAQLSPVDSVIEGNINSNAFLTKNKRYLLRGFVNVNPPATLTIEAGTVIYGEKSSKGTLIINRGAKINANGTAQNPIVFTSQQPVGQRGPGDWGGIIIAGNARINVPGGTATLEGGTGTVYGGGANPNDNDNSGVLRYVRIEFPGIAFLPDNEINGLTLGGVGKGTTIEYIQVSYSGDDSFEWFGGSVDGKYLIAYKGIDDDFDMDIGFNGNLQFGLGLRDPNLGDISGSNGFEIDNDATGSFNAPRTFPIISNFTVVGPMSDTAATGYNPNFRRGAHLRRATQSSFYNSIVMGYPTGLLLDGSAVANGCTGDTLQIRNSIWAGLRFNNGIISNVQGFNAANWFNTAIYANRTFVQPSGVGITNVFNTTNPNPLPALNSPATSGASFSNPRLGSFFTQTTYVGAFGTTRWDLPWANYDPQNINYTSVEEKYINSVPSDFNLSQNYPNPFNPSTKIVYSVAKATDVKLYVTNILGQTVEVLVDDFKEDGTYEITFNAENLSTGLYIYTLEAGDVKVSKKMTLVK